MTNKQLNIAIAKWHTEKQSSIYPPDTFTMVGKRLVHHDFDSAADNFVKPYTESLDTMRLALVFLTEQEQADVWEKIEEHEDMCFKVDCLMVEAEMIAEATASVLGLNCETAT